MPRELLPEIWTLVFSHLRNPTPLPLSDPPRDQLRQPHLAVVQRVCKTWEHLSEPLLYSTIVTDDLPTLLIHLSSRSMHRRLSFTHTLYIEYMPSYLEATYQKLCRAGGRYWALCGRDRLRLVEGEFSAVAQCRIEAKRLSSALEWAKGWGMDQILPNLEKLAVQAMYTASTWDQFGPNGPMIESDPLPTEACRGHFTGFIASGNRKHVCIRSNCGPLFFPFVSYESDAPTKFTKTIHFGAQAETRKLCLHVGSPMKWICDAQPDADWGKLLYDVGQLFYQIGRQREDDQNAQSLYDLGSEMLRFSNGRPRAEGQRYDIGDLEIFCSTAYLAPGALEHEKDWFGIISSLDLPHEVWRREKGYDSGEVNVAGYNLSLEQQEKIITQVMNSMRFGGVRNPLDKPDVIKWHPSGSIPTCLACGSGAPRGRDS